MDQFKEITKKARSTAKDMMKFEEPEDYETIKPFIPVLKNSFNKSEIPKALALSMNIPIIEEELDRPIYTKDIDNDTNIDENIKDICREIRRKNKKAFNLWWAKSGLNTIQITNDMLKRLSDDNIKKLNEFGYTKEMLKEQETKQIRCMPFWHTPETPEKQLIDCGISSINVYKRIQPPNSIKQQKMDAVYISNKEVMDIFDDHTQLKICKYLLKLNSALLIYVNCTNSALLQIAYSISSQQRQIKCDDLSAKLDNMILENRRNTDRICGKLEDVENQLKDKNDVVSNTENKGIIIVKYLDESNYDISEDEYLIYLHGGKRSYWNTYNSKPNKYDVLYKFETISDHDKAIRTVKKKINITPINPKRHLFILKQEQIDTLGKWFEEWETKNK